MSLIGISPLGYSTRWQHPGHQLHICHKLADIFAGGQMLLLQYFSAGWVEIWFSCLINGGEED